jgi:hypothetical protein
MQIHLSFSKTLFAMSSNSFVIFCKMIIIYTYYYAFVESICLQNIYSELTLSLNWIYGRFWNNKNEKNVVGQYNIVPLLSKILWI